MIVVTMVMITWKLIAMMHVRLYLTTVAIVTKRILGIVKLWSEIKLL